MLADARIVAYNGKRLGKISMRRRKRQLSFIDAEYESRKDKDPLDKFLDSMDRTLPWDDWLAMIKPYYYNNTRGRPPVELEVMLRMYFLQAWFNLSDVKTERECRRNIAFIRFLGIDMIDERAPDATTLCKFRNLLVANRMGEKIFEDVAERLERAGLMMHGGTIVDSTIIDAPSSTKNREKRRDPEMCQTKKGGQWYFGMKVHIAVDAGTGYVYSVEVTAANVHDVTVTYKLIRYGDVVVYGDSGYLGIDKRDEIKNDRRFDGIEWKISRKPSSIKASFEDERYTAVEKEEENCEPPAGNDSVKAGRRPAKKKKNKKGKRPSDEKKDEQRRKTSAGKYADKVVLFRVAEKHEEHSKSSVRCKVEHDFLIVKRDFGYTKARYRGLAKNAERLRLLFAFANIVKCIRAGRAEEFCRGRSAFVSA